MDTFYNAQIRLYIFMTSIIFTAKTFKNHFPSLLEIVDNLLLSIVYLPKQYFLRGPTILV